MHTIVLYGNSVALSTIGAGLGECPDATIVRVTDAAAAADEWLAARDPIAVVFDRLATPPDFAMQLLDRYPDALFVGVDPSADRLLVLSGRQSQPESAASLLQGILARFGL